jgi:hypothetical protein
LALFSLAVVFKFDAEIFFVEARIISFQTKTYQNDQINKQTDQVPMLLNCFPSLLTRWDPLVLQHFETAPRH